MTDPLDELDGAFRLANLKVTDGKMEAAYSRPPVPLALLADAGLTADHLHALGSRRERRRRDAAMFAALVVAGVPVEVVARASRLGCGPADLEDCLCYGSQNRQLRVRIAAAVVAAAGLGLLGGPDQAGGADGGPDDRGRWPVAARTAGMFLRAGADPSPERLGGWSDWNRTAARDALGYWLAARPAARPVDRWLDDALPFAAAGLCPVETVRLLALPAEDPGRPGLLDLAVMSSLART